MKFLTFYSAIFLLLVNVDALALETQPQTWLQAIVSGSLSDQVTVYFEAQPRFGSFLSNLDRLLLRPAVYYKIDSHWQLWLGGLYIPKTRPRNTQEYRVWQQVQYFNTWGTCALQARVRLEERFVPDGDLAWRLRALARISPALNAHWRLIVQNEIFFHINKVSPKIVPGFDQNRFLLGLGTPLSEHLKMEFGYLNSYIHQQAPNDLMIHALNLAFIWTL